MIFSSSESDEVTPENGDAPHWGEAAELWACDYFGYEHADEKHYDVLNDCERIQIKACRKWVKNGIDSRGNQTRCRGRFKFWEGDHDELVGDDGRYLLIVYEKDEDKPFGIEVCAHEHFDPDEVREEINGDWYSENDIREASKGQVYRTTWPSFFEKGGI